MRSTIWEDPGAEPGASTKNTATASPGFTDGRTGRVLTRACCVLDGGDIGSILRERRAEIVGMIPPSSGRLLDANDNTVSFNTVALAA